MLPNNSIITMTEPRKGFFHLDGEQSSLELTRNGIVKNYKNPLSIIKILLDSEHTVAIDSAEFCGTVTGYHSRFELFDAIARPSVEV